ncbi:MAG: hypothetical protein ABR588_00370 [Sphingomicrobium sp.]
MAKRLFSEEARRCRAWAAELKGRAEEPLLLRIAHAFDALASERGPAAGWVPRARPFEAQRRVP